MDANKAPDKIPPGPTAEKVFRWKNVYKHEGGFVGKRQDRAGAVNQGAFLFPPTLFMRMRYSSDA